MWQTALGIIATLGLAALLARQLLAARARRRDEPYRLFAEVMEVLDDAKVLPGPTYGSYRLAGRHHGLDVQVQTVVDTLSVRKLPSLWLMVTIADSLPVKATFDLMMRPAGPTTFSNYENLPDSAGTPPGFPEQAIIRTDNQTLMVPPRVVLPHLDADFRQRGKELLISPKGLRLVVQLGEADRVRYGVLRQAEFGEARIEEIELRGLLDRLMTLRTDILAWQAAA